MDAEKKLTRKQQRFVEEYLVDLNASQAAIRAGYSEKSATNIAAQLLGKTHVKSAIDAELALKRAETERRAEQAVQRAERTVLTQQWVRDKLIENVERAMQAVPVCDREGNETGEYQYQGNVANKALELLGKTMSMFVDRQEMSGPDGKPIEMNGAMKFDLKSMDREDLKVLLDLRRRIGRASGSGAVAERN